MPFPYKKVVVFGATSGIGEALAHKLVQEEIFVIAVGRRKENLEALVQQHGHDKVQAIPLDISKLDTIPHFATNIINTHPDLDCLILNAGIQRRVDFSEPDSVDLEAINLEFTTNYLSQLALTKAFLPFFLAKSEHSGLIYTTSGLAMVPIIRCPNYCATKAALHSFILCLRVQLQQSNVKVIELYPPAVQTELHDEEHQPDIRNGRAIGMPLKEFIDEAWNGLANEVEQIPVGTAKTSFDVFEIKRQEIFNKMVKAMGSAP